MYYYLVPRCAPDMALSVDKLKPTGGLILMTFAANEPSQMWETAYSISDRGTGIVLINKLSGLAAYAPDDHKNVQQISIQELDGRSIWTLGGTSPVNNTIRTLHNTGEQNLNASGDGPWHDGTPVCIGDGTGGAWNDKWSFKPA